MVTYSLAASPSTGNMLRFIPAENQADRRLLNPSRDLSSPNHGCSASERRTQVHRRDYRFLQACRRGASVDKFSYRDHN